MDAYFQMITIVDVFVLAIMCVLTKYNDTLDRRQRFWFINAFLMEIAITLLEVVSVLVDGGAASLRWVNIVSNYLGFGLTPLVSIFLASALEKHRSIRVAVGVEIAYLVFLAASLPFGVVFWVDWSNVYARGEQFWVFLAMYFVSVVYLLGITLHAAARYQNSSRVCVCLIIAFLLLSTWIQVMAPQIHISWLCVTMLSMLYFTDCNSMWQQLDGLTGLLNQKSYLNATASRSGSGTLVVIDIDNFKQINDQYGHLAGDRCLEEIADCIKKAYGKAGNCYRIGGDEFCVLLKPNVCEIACRDSLLRELNSRQSMSTSYLPHLSVGCAAFAPGDDLLRIKDMADQAMYEAKRKHKGGEAA